jgi:hypothetical protein
LVEHLQLYMPPAGTVYIKSSTTYGQRRRQQRNNAAPSSINNNNIKRLSPAPLRPHQPDTDCLSSDLPCPQSRTGNGVRRQRGIGVEQNSRIGFFIEVGSKCACRVFRAGTCDIYIDTERIVLSAIEGSSAVAGDDFMAEDVVSCSSSLVLTFWRTPPAVQAEGKL